MTQPLVSEPEEEKTYHVPSTSAGPVAMAPPLAGSSQYQMPEISFQPL